MHALNGYEEIEESCNEILGLSARSRYVPSGQYFLIFALCRSFLHTF